MLKKMINKHRMQIAVVEFLLRNIAKLTFAPALTGLVTKLQGIMTRITETQEAQINTSKGHTQTKEALRAKVISCILEIIKRAKAYAIASENLLLKDAVDYNLSQLSIMPQDSLAIACNKVISACAPLHTEMAGYGLTPAMLADMETLLVEYTAALPGTKLAIASRKTATGGLAELFAEADSTLKKIDAMMEIVSTTDHAFYKEYKNLRVIDDLKRKAPVAETPVVPAMEPAK